MPTNEGRWRQKGTGIRRVYCSWRRNKRARSTLTSAIGTEAGEWGAQLMEKQGKRNCLLRTLISGLSIPLIERRGTNMAQDVDRGICIKSGTGQIWDRTNIIQKGGTRSAKNLCRLCPESPLKKLFPAPYPYP